MARVPISQNLVSRRPMTDAKFQSFGDDGGSAVARGIEAFGAGLSRFSEAQAEEEARRQRLSDLAAETAAKRADNAYVLGAGRLAAIIDDPEADPFDAAAQAQAAAAALRERLLAETRSPLERALIAPALDRRAPEVAADLQSRAEARARGDALAVSKTRQRLAAERYLRALRDPATAAGELLVFEAEQRAQMRLLGRDAQTAEALAKVARSGLHRDAIEALLAGDVDAAQFYAEIHRAAMTEGDARALDDTLATARRERQALVRADRLLGVPTGPSGIGAVGATGPDGAAPRRLDRADLAARAAALADAEGLDPEDRAALADQLDRRARRADDAVTAIEDAAYATAWEAVAAAGRGFDSLTRIAPAILRALAPAQRDALAGIAAQNRLPPAARTTDADRLLALAQDYADDPAAFARRNPADYRAPLSDRDFATVSRWRDDATGSNGARTPAQITHGRVMRALTQLAATGDAGLADAVGRLDLFRHLSRQVGDEELQRAEMLTTDDIRDIAMTLENDPHPARILDAPRTHTPAQSASGPDSNGPLERRTKAKPLSPSDARATHAANSHQQRSIGALAKMVVPRSKWTSSKPFLKRMSHADQPYNEIVFHHTYTKETPQSVYDEHVHGNKWGDIGYHFLIGRDGTIYEGRNIRYEGSHVLDHNKGKIGIAFLGDYHIQPNTKAQIRSARRLTDALKAIYPKIGRLSNHGMYDPTRIAETLMSANHDLERLAIERNMAWGPDIK